MIRILTIFVVTCVLFLTVGESQPVVNTTCKGWGDAVSTITAAGCSASGVNRLALICGAWGHVDTVEADTDANYGGTAATHITRVAPGGSGSVGTSLYRVVPSVTPSQTVTMNFFGFVRGVVGVTTFTNVDSTVPLGTAVSNNSTSTTASVNVPSSTNELVSDCVLLTDPSGVTSTGTIQWSQETITGGLEHLGGGATKTGVTSTNMSWSSANNALWAIIGVSVKPVAAAAVTRKRGVYVYP